MKRKRIDMWKLDPNWKFAAEHGLASRPGVESSTTTSRKNSILMCPCCLQIIHKEPVSLCENPKELSFLGYGFPLFYNMLQYCIISLFILILSESSILLFLSLNQECHLHSSRLLAAINDPNYPCTSFFIRMARVTEKTQDFTLDRIIRALSFVGQSFFMIYLRDVQRKLAAYHTQRNTRIKDFSVIFRDMPKINGIQEAIRKFLESLGVRLEIQEIFLMPKIDYFHQLEQEKKEIIEHMKRVMEDERFSGTLKTSLEAQLERVNYQLLQTCKKIDSLYQKDELFSQKAIVILETKEQKKEVLEQFKRVEFKKLESYFAWMAGQVSLSSAPEPREIIWQNINYPKYRRWLRVVLGWTVTLLFLAVTTGVFYFLVVFKAESHSMTLLILTLLLIQFFNKYIMKIFLHWFSDIEMPETSSDRQFSYAFKYTLGMFFTIAIMPLLVQAIVFDNLKYQYGVVEGETIMFFFNAFIVNLLWILHPQYYLRKLARWRNFGKKTITQKEANHLMQDYPYDMGKRYAEILQTMWFTFLYASLIPFGSFLSFVGLSLYYWVDKYNLLRRSKVENIIESKLPIQAVKLMEFTLFWKPLGEILFDSKLRGIVYAESIVMLCLSVIFVFLPWDCILDTFFYEKFNISKESFQQVKYRFTETYQTVDPIQRMLALERFIENQNKARKELQKKDAHTMLQIRQYDDASQNRSEKNAKEMVRQELGMSDTIDEMSINIKMSETYGESNRFNDS